MGNCETFRVQIPEWICWLLSCTFEMLKPSHHSPWAAAVSPLLQLNLHIMPALLPHFPSSPSRPFTIKKLIMLSAKKPYSPHTPSICCTLICSNPSVIPASSVVLSIFTVPFLVLRKLPSSSELRLHFLPLCLRPSGLRVMRIWRFNETFRVKKCFFGCWGTFFFFFRN